MMNKKIVFIGNSIVNGFPYQRGASFAGIIEEETGFEIINRGINGQTASEVLSRFERDVISQRPDMVFVLTGTNDFIYGQNIPEHVFSILELMKEKADAEGISAVFLTPLPTDSEMASRCWRVWENIDYERINRCLSALSDIIMDSGFDFIDLNSLYRECGKYCDGVHPLPEGHRFIADRIMEYLNRI